MVARARATRWMVVGVSTALVLLATLGSCREATQVSLEARTNVTYRSGIMTSFAVGSSPSTTEAAGESAASNAPWGPDGFVGSLTVVPSESDSRPLAIKIVMGVSRLPSECRAPFYEGCIVARRLVRYVENRPLHLPITLWSQCENIPCDADSTCNALKQCVSAQVDASSCATSKGCAIAGDEGLDSGAQEKDASNSNDATTTPKDGSSGDGSPGFDSGSDASSGGDGGTPGRVECNSASCDLDLNFCCAKTLNSYCAASALEAETACVQSQGGVVVRCDGPEDCSLSQCCLHPNNTFGCLASCGGSLTVCHSTGTCPAGQSCNGMTTTGYRICAPN